MISMRMRKAQDRSSFSFIPIEGQGPPLPRPRCAPTARRLCARVRASHAASGGVCVLCTRTHRLRARSSERAQFKTTMLSLASISATSYAGAVAPIASRAAVVKMETAAELKVLAEKLNPVVGFWDPVRPTHAGLYRRAATASGPAPRAARSLARLLFRAPWAARGGRSVEPLPPPEGAAAAAAAAAAAYTMGSAALPLSRPAHRNAAAVSPCAWRR